MKKSYKKKEIRDCTVVSISLPLDLYEKTADLNRSLFIRDLIDDYFKRNILKGDTVLEKMQLDGIETALASPNFVSEYAQKRGINLSSEQVVRVSNEYQNLKKAV